MYSILPQFCAAFGVVVVVVVVVNTAVFVIESVQSFLFCFISVSFLSVFSVLILVGLGRGTELRKNRLDNQQLPHLVE